MLIPDQIHKQKDVKIKTYKRNGCKQICLHPSANYLFLSKPATHF